MLMKLVRRNISATKGRLALMLLSIVLGVSFVSGSFLIADSLRSVFQEITQESYAGIDLQIRAAENELSSRVGTEPYSQEVLEVVKNIDGIKEIEPSLFAFETVFVLDKNGAAIRPMGPPVLTQAWDGKDGLSSLNITQGSSPGDNQIAIDSIQARAAGLNVGDIVDVTSQADGIKRQMMISGIADFGEEGASGGAYLNTFNLPTLQELLGTPGLIDSISISVEEGVKANDLKLVVEDVLKESPTTKDIALEVIPGQTLADEQAQSFDTFVSIFGNILLGFAIVVLFVSTFIIYNTFAILISQRIRQLGLLRAIGATGSQLTKMVLGEAVVMGVLASILGLFGGVGIAYILRALFDATGGGIPSGPILFKARTIIVVFVLGIGVTVISALLPARLANRISPLEAMQDGLLPASGSRSRRIIFGSVVTLIAFGLVGYGLFSNAELTPRLSALGIGSALLFVGMSLLSVLFASISTGVIGAPLAAVGGLSGRLGKDNAQRNPQRTATTATALMIGLALITGVLVLTQSLRTSFNKILDEVVAADLMVYDMRGGEFASTPLGDIEAIDSVSVINALTTATVRIDGEKVEIVGWNSDTANSVIDVKLVEGEQSTGDNGILIFDDTAAEQSRSIGDVVEIEFADGATDTFEISGIYSDRSIVDRTWLIDRSVIDQHRPDSTVSWVGITYKEGADSDTVRAQVEEITSGLAQLQIQDNTEFKAQLNTQIDQLMGLIIGLLALCIVVAFIGIVNTMALSVMERTREIGLLRAVGSTRSQVRRMIRTEATIVALFGSALGVILGLIIGYAAVEAIPDTYVSTVDIPWIWVAGFLIVGALLGTVAALLPARRAAKMDVLEAISSV